MLEGSSSAGFCQFRHMLSIEWVLAGPSSALALKRRQDLVVKCVASPFREIAARLRRGRPNHRLVDCSKKCKSVHATPKFRAGRSSQSKHQPRL